MALGDRSGLGPLHVVSRSAKGWEGSQCGGQVVDVAASFGVAAGARGAR